MQTILDIYVPRVFQWYKELLNPMGFNLYNHSLKIQDSIGTPTPKVEVHLGEWRFIPSHSLTLPNNMKCDSRASLLANTFASPCFGHKPKARVVASTHKNVCQVYK